MAKKVTLLFEEVRDGKKSNGTFLGKCAMAKKVTVLFGGSVRWQKK